MNRVFPPYEDHEEATVRHFRDDPEFALYFLDATLADGDQQEIMLALRRVALAFGGIPEVAAKAGLNPTTLYRTLSETGNPELRSLTALLGAMGMRLAVVPLKQKPATLKVVRPKVAPRKATASKAKPRASAKKAPARKRTG